ncbi:MAG: Rrf2 family transcriptional regulator [Lachnospiraceae bacterium]|nr:Rrf2 family transcriptional regulator [Lachnospiraceae bacterium]
MMLSTKGKYGLKAVLDLAMHTEEGAIPLSSIAERQNISMNYLEQIIPKLKKAGIVNSIRGAQGGYVLAKPASEVSVGAILRALEGNLDPVNCSELSGDKSCAGSDNCVTKFVWKRISDSINNTVNQMWLSELVEEGRKIKGEDNKKE